MDEIKIIQGDTYEAKLKCTGIEDFSIIDKIFFSCADLSVCKEIKYDEEAGSYVLKFTPEETAKMPACITDFDITVRYTDSNRFTPIYRKRIVVQRKVNACDGT